VESAVIRVDPRSEPVVNPELEAKFRRFVQDSFGMRRKQMRRVLRSLANVDAERADQLLIGAEIDPTARPETLSPEQFARLISRGW